MNQLGKLNKKTTWEVSWKGKKKEWKNKNRRKKNIEKLPHVTWSNKDDIDAVVKTCWLHNLIRKLHSPLKKILMFIATMSMSFTSSIIQLRTIGRNILRWTYTLSDTNLSLAIFKFCMYPVFISTATSLWRGFHHFCAHNFYHLCAQIFDPVLAFVLYLSVKLQGCISVLHYVLCIT